MLAPSPDWFTGIKNLDMCVDGYWLPTKTVHSVPYDAGVDGGTFFRTADVPVLLNVNKIAKITCDVAGGPFCNQATSHFAEECLGLGVAQTNMHSYVHASVHE